jgi:hypothetical protein
MAKGSTKAGAKTPENKQSEAPPVWDDFEQECSTCGFWLPQDLPARLAGHCKRFPPSMPPRASAWALWPLTKAGDWCGEFMSAKKGPVALSGSAGP